MSLAVAASLVTLPAAAQERAPTPSASAPSRNLDVRPYVGAAAVPNSVTTGFVGADAVFWLGRVGIGGDFAWYSPFNQGPGARPSYPLNESILSGGLDFYLAPWEAHLDEGWARALEPYVVAGPGLMVTRPIAVVDPVHRQFSNNNLIDLSLGLGARLFATRRLAIALEVRDTVYFDKWESPRVAPGSTSLPPASPDNPVNPSTWYDVSTHFTNAVSVRLGASFSLL
jgi:hypothetical protein